jgi:putative flippase GtrA
MPEKLRIGPGRLVLLMVAISGSPSLREHLRSSWRILLKELTAFGLVGAVGFVIDVGLFNLFFDKGQVVAKCISTFAATTVTYFGNRYFSFSHRARTGIGRETSLFFSINVIALLFSLAIIGVFEYPLHFKHHLLAMNLVNLATIGIGTIFRFWSYKRFVFLHPDRVHSQGIDLDVELAE